MFEFLKSNIMQISKWIDDWTWTNEQNLLVREKPSIGLLAFGPIVWVNENGLEIVRSWG